jgi:anti-sigma B factor antagonist
MEIAERKIGGVVILDIVGKLILDRRGSIEMLPAKINDLLYLQGKRQIILNLERVPLVDATGLGEIVRASMIASRFGGKIKLLKINRGIKGSLVYPKLLTVFDTFEDEAEAVKSFSETPAT